MYARTVTIHVREGKLDEATRIYRDSVMPAARLQKGFISTFLLTDNATKKGMSVTLWETEEDLLANESSGYFQEQLAKFSELISAPPVRELFTVSVQS